MSQKPAAPHMQIIPRRSSRLKKFEIIRPETGLLGQQASKNQDNSNQRSCSSNTTSKLLELPAEVRLMIVSHLVTTERPFMIGRCQEERRKIQGSPRDIFSFHQGKFKVRRNDDRNRPIQPAITRVCRTLREQALPLWYSENRFWLIHNEFEAEDGVPNHHRGFDTWISQTPLQNFNLMRHVSLCGYSSWPNRLMISLDLKTRQVTNIRHYSTYGDELPIYQQEFIDSTKRALGSKAADDGLEALQTVLSEQDGIFQISREYITTPPGMMRREPASGWEYDW